MNKLVSNAVFFTLHEKLLLKNINFEFNPGKIICILGPNGCGKSTLLKLCAGLLKPTQGKLTYDKADVSHCSKDKLGWLPQQLNRPHNLLLSEFMELRPLKFKKNSKPIENNSTYKYLELFELEQLKNSPIATLSGGEWKRAQLARIWQTNCSLMLLDEPDSELDLRHKKLLAKYCKQFVHQNNRILFIATHDIVFANDIADVVCALSDGHLVWNSENVDFWNKQVIDKIFSTKVRL